MAPRGRPRKRNTRLDAAIDAMTQLGFSEELIRAQVKELLNVYGGDEGWVFIEDSSYAELREACLEANKQHENAEEGNLLQNGSSQDQNAEERAVLDIAGPSDADLRPITSEDVNTVQDIGSTEDRETLPPGEGSTFQQGMHSLPPVESDGRGWKDNGLDQISHQKEAAKTLKGNSLPESLPDQSPDVSSPPVIPPPPSANIYPKQRPCYGWIDSDEDEEEVNDFILLPPAPRLMPASSVQAEHSDGGTNKTIQCKPRWDLKPGDP